ncbi:hypothetical protein [Arthrobacter sp. H20]|uniref:hypothetical protein n=1 Tax=Arthrobacter sp. H20 TaxID=1267981 RepID=UPI0004797382|nr:hypothetical protein [Arthrobacter sp. H20]
MNTITYAPRDLVVATCDAIDVRFAGVALVNTLGGIGLEVGLPCIQLHLNGVRGLETMIRDGQRERELQEWSERRKAEGPDSKVVPSKMPGVVLFERIAAHVTDDLGTEYRQAGGHVAGGGTEWDAAWIFLPSPPENARTLRIEFSVDGESSGKHCEVSL